MQGMLLWFNSCHSAPALRCPAVVPAPPKRAHTRAASLPQAAVVVVASQRKSGISEFLLGSVAAHCAQHSSRPVLVVHAPQPGGSGAAGPGLMGRLASAAAAALGGHPEDAEQQRAAAAAAAEQQRQQLMQRPACSVGRHVILAVDDSGREARRRFGCFTSSQTAVRAAGLPCSRPLVSSQTIHPVNLPQSPEINFIHS